MRERLPSVLILFTLGCAQSREVPVEVDPDWVVSDTLSADLNVYYSAYCRGIYACTGQDFFRECNVEVLADACNPSFKDARVAGLAACVSAMRARPCEARSLPECFGAREAVANRGMTLVREGAACDTNFRLTCDDDLYCNVEDGGCGTCRPTSGVGEACEFPATCKDSTNCIDGECRARKKLGESCKQAYECSAFTQCSDGQCKPRRVGHIGDACEQHADCYLGACKSGKCGSRAACGQAREGAYCWGVSCASGYRCVDSECVKAVKDGDKCDPEQRECDRNSVCADGVCTARLSDGEPCAPPFARSAQECSSGFCLKGGLCGLQPSACED